jgi:DNA-binding protein YbaB
MEHRPISHLRADFEALSAEFERSRKQLDVMQRRMPTLRGTAESPDKLVTVTVGARGELRELEIDPKAYRKLSPTELAETIVETTAKASRAAFAEVEQLLKPFMSFDGPFEKLMSGELDWSEHVRFKLPSVSPPDRPTGPTLGS